MVAILKGRRTSLPIIGQMRVCSIGPHVTRHDDKPADEENVAKFYDGVTG